MDTLLKQFKDLIPEEQTVGITFNNGDTIPKIKTWKEWQDVFKPTAWETKVVRVMTCGYLLIVLNAEGC